MSKKIEIGIAGRGLNINSFSWVEGIANELSIKGAVFTKSDGSIRVTAEGEEQALRDFASKIERGNIFSSIDNFYVKWDEARERNFYVLAGC